MLVRDIRRRRGGHSLRRTQQQERRENPTMSWCDCPQHHHRLVCGCESYPVTIAHDELLVVSAGASAHDAVDRRAGVVGEKIAEFSWNHVGGSMYSSGNCKRGLRNTWQIHDWVRNFTRHRQDSKILNEKSDQTCLLLPVDIARHAQKATESCRLPHEKDENDEEFRSNTIPCQ